MEYWTVDLTESRSWVALLVVYGAGRLVQAHSAKMEGK